MQAAVDPFSINEKGIADRKAALELLVEDKPHYREKCKEFDKFISLWHPDRISDFDGRLSLKPSRVMSSTTLFPVLYPGTGALWCIRWTVRREDFRARVLVCLV